MQITDSTKMYIGDDMLLFLLPYDIKIFGYQLENIRTKLKQLPEKQSGPFLCYDFGDGEVLFNNAGLQVILDELDSCLEFQEVFEIYKLESPHPALEFAALLRENKRGDYEE